MQSPNVTTIIPAQTDACARALNRAFHTDPMYTYIALDDEKRARQLHPFFRAVVRIGQWQGQVYTTANADGTAVWLSPGKSDIAPPNILRSGMARAMFGFGRGGIRRFFDCINTFEESHKLVMDGEPSHWYLLALGVDPAQQGRGLGGRLIEPVLAKADAAGLTCYLETLKRSNLAFYEKHGFQIVHNGRVRGGDMPFWAMRRAPISRGLSLPDYAQ